MFSFWKNTGRRWQMKKLLLPLLDEMERNLEKYYVMDQRQFIESGFEMDAWIKAQKLKDFNFDERLKHYAYILEEFNKFYAAFKEYERWYASDLNNKTAENAKVLHSQKQELEKRMKKLDRVIIPAGQVLEKKLLELKIIKQ